MPAGFEIHFQKSHNGNLFQTWNGQGQIFLTWMKRSHDLALRTDKNATKSVNTSYQVWKFSEL